MINTIAALENMGPVTEHSLPLFTQPEGHLQNCD